MTLDVLIATCAPAGIGRVERMELPAVEGVRYIVSWQAHGDAPAPPALERRPDVLISRFDGVGLSRNRNNAIELSTADIMLMADDDLTYTSGRLRGVIEAFERRPGMMIALFRYEGEDAKTYPAAEQDIVRMPKGYFVSSIEIAVRRQSDAGRLRFDANFGLGSGRWPLGEDSVFILTAQKLGITPRFIPLTICRHRGLSTGMRKAASKAALRGQGACMILEYPLTAPLRILLKSWRDWRRGLLSLPEGVLQMTAGALEAKFRYTPPWRK